MIMFSLSHGIVDGLRWSDELDGVYDPGKLKPKWKPVSAVMRLIIWVGFPLFIYVIPEATWYHWLIAVVVSWPVFPIAINITRGMPWYYVGTTSVIDRAMGSVFRFINNLFKKKK